jgi:lipopolysaccharide transport system ATP-binding protein
MMNKSKVIEAKNIGQYFLRKEGKFSTAKFWALKDVSFTLFKGECLGVIGRNGAGKSTLLGLLAGIVNPDRGILVNHGYSTSLLSLQAGFVPYLTGRENTMLSGLTLGLKKSFIREKMDAIYKFSGLGDFFDLPINSYSRGMQARLGFSIAFQLDPDVLLIDEVLGVGDEVFRNKSEEKMKEKIRSDKTVVIVSHSALTIKELCNRAVWIEDGVNKMEGGSDEVLNEYQNFLKKEKR